MHHGDNDIFSRSDQVHGSSHPLYHLPGDLPIGNVSVLSHFHGPKYGKVHMLPADHGKTGGGIEKRGSGKGSDSLLARIDDIGVLFPFIRKGAHSKHAIFALEFYLNIIPYKVGHQGRNPNSQVDVVTVPDLFGNAFGYSVFI